MSQIPDSEAPINPLPPVVIALAVIFAAVEIVLSAANYGLIGGADGIGWRTTAVENFGFFTTIFDWMFENGRFPPDYLWRFVTYSFVQASPLQAVFAVVFVLAIGKFVSEYTSQWAMLVTLLLSAFVGAVVYALVSDARMPLVGAWPAVFGVLGMYTYVLYRNLKVMGQNPRIAQLMFAFFTLVLVAYGLWVSPTLVWIAQPVGLWTGAVLGWLFFPGRWTQILGRLRARS